MLEQRVWLETKKGYVYPNIYCFLVAHPGVGKTSTIVEAERYYLTTPKPHKAPTSMTGAAMVDSLIDSRRKVDAISDPRDPKKGPLEYNSMFLTADELGAFMHKYDNEIISNMSAFYDPREYIHWRRGNTIRIHIKHPQLNLLCGTTPSNLMNVMPESAWEQGFTSRVIMVFSDMRITSDDFVKVDNSLSPDMIHDLNRMTQVMGGYSVTQEYQDLFSDWRDADEVPKPTHPKLAHYNTRRKLHLYKLSLISAVDRSDVLLITAEDFHRAMSWLLEAEASMGDIFKAGAGNADQKAMEEIHHYVVMSCVSGKPIPGTRIVNFAKSRVSLNVLDKVVKMMESAGMIRQTGMDPFNKGIALYLPGDYGRRD